MGKENAEEYTEFVVRAFHIWIAAGVFIVLCISFFFLGRWYERSISQYSPARSSGDPGSVIGHPKQAASAAEDLGESLTFFDTLPKESSSDMRFPAGSETQIKKTEKAPASRVPVPRESSVEEKKKPSQDGYSIQVFASKEKTSAQRIYQKLAKSGYECFIKEEKSASGSTYKVRVGNFATKEEAQKMESTLKKAGYGTWVTKAE